MGMRAWERMLFCLCLLWQGVTGTGRAACMATAGSSYRWPVENKGLAAPIQPEFSYMQYGDPIQAVLTETSISMKLPSDFLGGFIVEELLASNITVSPEAYRLVRIEVRKAGKNRPGVAQQLPHGLEVALVHEEVGGDKWANVIVGVEVDGGADPDLDILTPMMRESSLPSRVGDEGRLFSNPGSIMDLNPLWYNATFLHFWGELPTECGAMIDTRFFMRTATIHTIQATYDTLLRALQLAPDVAVLHASDDAWLVQACPSGSTCDRLMPQDPAKDLVHYQQLQSVALRELRERRQALDDALANLEINKKGALEIAYSARNDLKSAESRLQSLMDQVSLMKDQAALVSKALWDSKAPGNSYVGSNISDVRSASPNATNLISSNSAFPAFASETCDSFGRSPIDIKTDDAIDPSLVSSAFLEPLQFKVSGLSLNASVTDPQLLINNLGKYLRISAPHSPKGTAGGPLGAIVANGLLQGVSYIDMHIPGEHAIDGRVAAMELQLFHQPLASEKPMVAVALRFDTWDDDNGAGNMWLARVADAATSVGLDREVAGRPLGELHQVFAEGFTSDYFRYDGTATSPPCRAAQWFVLKDAGHLGSEELTALKKALIVDPPDGMARPRFHVKPIAYGTQHLVSRVVPVGASAAVGTLGVDGHNAALRGRRRMKM